MPSEFDDVIGTAAPDEGGGHLIPRIGAQTCEEEWRIRIPQAYVTLRKEANATFYLGDINLEVGLSGDRRHCSR